MCRSNFWGPKFTFWTFRLEIVFWWQYPTLNKLTVCFSPQLFTWTVVQKNFCYPHGNFWSRLQIQISRIKRLLLPPRFLLGLYSSLNICRPHFWVVRHDLGGPNFHLWVHRTFWGPKWDGPIVVD